MAKKRPARTTPGTTPKSTKTGRANGPAPAAGAGRKADAYLHPTAESPLRPEIGTQAQFKKTKPAAKYRYDDSLDPALSWDDPTLSPAREQGEAFIACLLERIASLTALVNGPDGLTPEQAQHARADLAAAQDAAHKLKALSRPFLNWAGKAERSRFTVPTLPLFIHERLSTQAIIATLQGHRKGRDQLDLFGDPQHSIADQVLKAYEFPDRWVNRMILGDSLVVMNSLLRYEGLGGQVQTIYMDPPYGVKFGSNFQPFVRQRDVSHNNDTDMTREPETVKAYRDTWEVGVHSYLTGLRDQFLVARELLAPTGSMFVQISDENVHHVREVMDEVFGAENFVALIPFRKKTMPLGTTFLEQMSDFLLWYARQAFDANGKRRAKYHRLYSERSLEGEFHYCWYELQDGSRHRMSKHQLYDYALLPPGSRVYRLKSLEPSGPMDSGKYDYEFEGTVYPPPGNGWGVTREGMDRLVKARRIQAEGNRLSFILFADEGADTQLTAPWADTVGADDKAYVVQTHTEVIRRCMLMTTDPGDLVLDPTCGNGTTAIVAEQWGRRWITIDVSRVPMALARQRLLVATFPWYALRDDARGPAGGFVYERRQNRKGEEVGGIIPHITVGTIANGEPAEEVVVVDRPEVDGKTTRVTGPFVVEATIPTAMDPTEAGEPTPSSAGDGDRAYADRMLEVLRKVKTLQLPGNRTLELRNVRLPAKSLALSAEAAVDATSLPGATIEDAVAASKEKDSGGLPLSLKPVAFVFGPENGAVSEKLVYAAAREAHGKGYAHLIVVGFGIEPNARLLVDQCEEAVGIAASYVQATMDLLMGDLLKNMRSSQVFSVCGLPDVKVGKATVKRADGSESPGYQVTLLALDVFDPVTMKNTPTPGSDVPAWLLDTDYNGRVFKVSQAFFPRTGAWENLKRALAGGYDNSVWDHLAGTTSAPFEAGENRQAAVKVIDDRGNELLVVKPLGK